MNILEEKFAGDDGKEYSLKDFQGKKVILYFYPKDNTPGCTTEACDFTSRDQNFQDLGYQIIGVSKDSIKSHQNFKEKHNLSILLLSDPDLILHKHFGAYGEKNNYGKIVTGVIRSTFILDENSKLIQEFRNVRAKGHAERIFKTVS